MSAEETQLAALVTDWSKIETEQTAPGITRQMVVGQHVMMVRFTFEPFLVTPQHTHPHEQMTLVVKGRVRFFISGEEHIVSAGSVLHFPPHTLHGATMMDEEVVLIDIFSPIREDFLE
jgi:quercetin dioxygenase-like cupin family protein